MTHSIGHVVIIISLTEGLSEAVSSIGVTTVVVDGGGGSIRAEVTDIVGVVVIRSMNELVALHSVTLEASLLVDAVLEVDEGVVEAEVVAQLVGQGTLLQASVLGVEPDTTNGG
jgi:hypothetical protein